MGTRHTKTETAASNQLAILLNDVVSLRREGAAAFSRWYRYRKAVRELSRRDDRDLHEIGIDRSEIEVCAYCLAEQAVSARPAA